MVLYQLVANGCYECFNGRGRIASRRVFAEKSKRPLFGADDREIRLYGVKQL